MITESELRDTLVRQAESYEVPPYDPISLRAAAAEQRPGTRLRYVGIAAAAAALLAVGVAWGLLRTGQGDVQPADSPSEVRVSPSCVPRGETPPVPDSPYAGAGFVSDSPVTATTTPRVDRPCTLVLRYGFHRFGAGAGLSGMVFLYSDGRLIVDTATGKDWFVQWERRLTPAGVERLRTAVVDMLDESASPPDDFLADIHYGDGIFTPKDPQGLVRLLIDRSWLPAEDWVTEDASIYRAAWYLTCYEMGGNPGIDVQAAVRDLPSGARDVLESRVWTALPPVRLLRSPNSAPQAVRYRCMVLSRAEATVLVEALGGDITVGTAIAFPRDVGLPDRRFSVHALMPDGTSGAHGD